MKINIIDYLAIKDLDSTRQALDRIKRRLKKGKCLVIARRGNETN